MKNSNTCQYFARLFQASLKRAGILCGASVVAALAFALPQQAQASGSYVLNAYFPDNAIETENGQLDQPPPLSVQMTGPAVIGSTGDYWNAVTGINTAVVNDPTYMTYANNLNSTVKLTISAPGGSFDNNCFSWGSYSPFSWTSTTAENAGTGYPNTPYAALMQCLLSGSSPVGYVGMTGLSPNAIYNLYTYSTGNAIGRVSTLWVTQGTGTAPGAAQGAHLNCTNDDTATTLILNDNYLEFANVQADSSGDLVIFFGAAAECDINGFQLQFVSGTTPVVPGPAPVITYTTNMNGLTICTNTSLVFTDSSQTSTIQHISVTNITTPLGLTVISTNVSTITANGSVSGGPSGCTITTTGIGTGTATVTMTLPQNYKYSVTQAATDGQPLANQASLSFDTYAPALVVEASDYNYGGGKFINTPANGGIYLYENVADAQAGVDYYKSGGEGGNALFYRDVDDFTTAGAPYVTEANADTVAEQKYAVATTGTNFETNDFPELAIGYTTPGDWLDYTRTFGPSATPAGNYNIYLFMGISGGGNDSSLSMVTPSPVTSGSQTTNHLGQFGTANFAENDWNGFEYVPMTDQYGNLLSVPITAGTQTFRIEQGPSGNPNLGFFMLVPATTSPYPAFPSYYPDGAHPFEASSTFTFQTKTADGTIASSGIDLVLNGVDVTSGLTLAQTNGVWTGSYPLAANTLYSALVTVGSSAGLTNTLSLSFDTFSTSDYQWEAVDYDYSTNNGTFSTPPAQGGEAFGGWISGLHIDCPSIAEAPAGIPTGDITGTATSGPLGTEATNSYFGFPAGFTSSVDPSGAGATAQQGVDVNFIAAGQSAGYELYRFGDIVGAQVTTDWLRPKFVTSDTTGWPNQIPPVAADPNVGPFNLCYISGGDWLNYTHNYPTGNYYVWGRMANSGNYTASFAVVTSGVGSTNQILDTLGTFTDNNASGYQAWHWIPLLTAGGQPAVLSITAQTTTVRYTANDGQNVEFFMLTPAPAGPLHVTATLVAGQIQLSFPTVTGSSYQVEFKSSLNSGSWTPSGSSIPGTGSTVTVSESLSGTQGFYQVVETQ